MRKLTTIILCALIASLSLSACASGYSSDYENSKQDYELEQYNWEQDAQVEQYKQDGYESDLVGRCLEENAGHFYSEDEAINYCENNLYDYEPDYYEEEYNYGW